MKLQSMTFLVQWRWCDLSLSHTHTHIYFTGDGRKDFAIHCQWCMGVSIDVSFFPYGPDPSLTTMLLQLQTTNLWTLESHKEVGSVLSKYHFFDDYLPLSLSSSSSSTDGCTSQYLVVPPNIIIFNNIKEQIQTLENRTLWVLGVHSLLLLQASSMKSKSIMYEVLRNSGRTDVLLTYSLKRIITIFPGDAQTDTARERRRQSTNNNNNTKKRTNRQQLVVGRTYFGNQTTAPPPSTNPTLIYP